MPKALFSGVAGAVSMALIVAGMSFPAQSATVEDLFTNTTSCFGLMISDAAAHARECGLAPDGDADPESLLPTDNSGEPDDGEEEDTDCNSYGFNLDKLQAGERVRVAAQNCPN